jgi:exonuclease SbcD
LLGNVAAQVLHGPQDVGAHIRYSGTPMKYAFGSEESQEKSVTLLDTETLERKIIPLPALHERTSVEGTYEQVLSAAGLSDAQRRGYVRARITDRYVGLEAMASLRETYPLLLEASGLSYDREDAGVRMTLEELEREADDPQSIFRRFCEDCAGLSPDEHLLALFSEAEADYERSVQA